MFDENGHVSRRDMFKFFGVATMAVAGSTVLPAGKAFADPNAKMGNNAANWVTPYNQAGIPMSNRQSTPECNARTIGSSVNMGDAGCAFFSFFSCVQMVGGRPDTCTVFDFLSENNKIAGSSKAVTTAQGYLSWGTAPGMSDGKLTYVGSIKGEQRKGYPELKKIWDKGNLAVFSVRGSSGRFESHWVSMAYADDKNIWMFDSSRGPGKLEESFYNGLIDTIHEYAPAKGAKRRVLYGVKKVGDPSSFGDAGAVVGGSSSSASASGAPVLGTYKLKSESELLGMDGYRLSSEQLKKISDDWKMPDNPPALAIEEQGSVEEIQVAIDANDMSVKDYINRGVSATGVGMILYSVLLITAHVFDRSNTLFEANMVSTLTGGKLESVDNRDDAGKGTGVTRVSFAGIFKYAFIGVAIGLLLISGYMSSMLAEVIYYVQHLG